MISNRRGVTRANGSILVAYAMIACRYGHTRSVSEPADEPLLDVSGKIFSSTVMDWLEDRT